MTSLARTVATLKRLHPSFPSVATDKIAGKELASIAEPASMIMDRLDALLLELYPDTADELLSQWEGICRIATRTADSLAVRRDRILSVLRRVSGPRLDQLQIVLAPSFDLTPEEIIFIEPLRSFIEEGLTRTDLTTYAITASPTLITFREYWPGEVDIGGVWIYVQLSALGTPTITVTSPDGTVWAPVITSADGWYNTKTIFRGETAGGDWVISVANGSAVNLTELRLMVSNDIDSAQIYNFYAFRDPLLSGTPDLIEAQRLFHRTALAHMNAKVIQSMSFIVDDPYSLVDRDPVGV
jgi:hypothetical protein